MSDESKIFGYFYKAFFTGLVLGIALALVGWVFHKDIWEYVYWIGILSFIILLIAIILNIWNA